MAQALRPLNAISRSHSILHLAKAKATSFSVQRIDAPPSKSMAAQPTMKGAAPKPFGKMKAAPKPKMLNTSMAGVAPHPGGARPAVDPQIAHDIANAIIVKMGRPPMPPYPPPAHVAQHAMPKPKTTPQPKAKANAESMQAPWCPMYGENHATSSPVQVKSGQPLCTTRMGDPTPIAARGVIRQGLWQGCMGARMQGGLRIRKRESN